jgi:hypothetical protein
MNMRNIVRTYNYLSPRQKMVIAIAAIVGGGVLLCIPLLSLQPPRSPVASSTGAAGNPNGGQNPSGEAAVIPSQASPLDTANPIDLPADSIGATGSDTFGSGNSSSSLGGDGSNTLDTAEPLDERVGNRQRSSVSSNDTLSNNIDNPYSQSTIRRYQTPASIGNSPYSASPGSNLSTTYSRAAGGSSSMSQSSSRLPNLEPAKGNDFTYLNPFSPNSGAGTTGVSPNATNLPGNPAAIPNQSAIDPSGLNGTGEGRMNTAPTNGSSSGFTSQTPAQTAPTQTRQNPSFPTPSSPGNMPNR